MKDTTKTYGILCLSSGTGLLLYWAMFLISNFMRVQRFGIEIPNLNYSTGVIGAVCAALLSFGVISLKSKTHVRLAMTRTREGRIGAIIRTDHRNMQLKPNQINRDTKTLSAISQLRKYDKIKFLAETATLALLISSYPLAALSMGFTFQQIIFSGSSPLMVISSQSMRPTLEYGDLILMKGSKTEDLVTGDIIAFKVPSPYDRVASSPTVHRVVGKWSENGEIYFKTKGDGNSEPDSWTVPADNVLGTYAQLKIPYVGSLVIFLKSPFGLALLILCLFLVFLYGYYKKRE